MEAVRFEEYGGIATFPLTEVRDAYRLLARGHVHGKVVLLP